MGQSRARASTGRLATGAAIAVLFTSTVLVARGGDQEPSDVVQVALLGVLAALALFVVVSLGVQLAGIDREVPGIAEHLADDADQRRLLARWLERARWARFVGGLSGLLVWLLGTNAGGNVLLLGTGGIALGAVLAELHRIRRVGGPRTARLEVRAVGDYLEPRDARWMLAVAMAAVVAAGIGAWSPETRAATWWGLGAVAVLGVARAGQHLVATRARPAVSARLTRADDLVRTLAIGRGLARPATYVALAIVGEACSSLEPALGGLGPLLGVAAWLSAVVLWWRNRRLGLDHLASADGELRRA